jgi:8-oxo-dGTP pyrophosphatase MutT (NUDIX family)/2'-5' RNA ligase
VIFDGDGRLFAPRRAAGAKLPGLWDIVGGHVEPGETLLDALAREVHEETGWTVAGEPELVFVSDWEIPGDRVGRREFDFVAPVAGDLDCPRLAPDEHDEFRWLGAHDLGLFDTNAGADQGLLRRLAEAAFSVRPPVTPASPHVTAFVEPVPEALGAARARWDPVMAALVAPHVTVAYPDELPPALDELVASVERVAANAAPFALRLGDVEHDGDPDRGLFVAVDDADGGWQRLRDAVTGGSDRTVPPHVTLVHQRSSGLGRSAWPELAALDVAGSFTVSSVAVTAFADGHWATVARCPLG